MTGNEQVSPTADESLRRAAEASTLARAGCAGGNASADASMQHDAVERRHLAGSGEQSLGAGALPGHHDLGGAQAQIDGIEQRHVHVEIFDRLRRDGGDQPVGLFAPDIVAGEQRQAG